MKINFVTLGCSKNEVDTSLMQSILDNRYKVTKSVEEAEIIVINTCGFIDAAKEESIDTILEASEYKENGRCKILLLAGCLAQRYSKELLELIPEVDGIIGTGNIKDINKVIYQSLANQKPVYDDNINDIYLEGNFKDQKDVKVTEYIKISEGCNNNCTYCIIPRLRGKNRSRRIEDILKEAQYLVERGTREIILIAQNTTDYGIDNYKEYKLAQLIRELSKIEDLKWIRVMYLYPDNFNEELINEFINNDKLIKYVDIPLQHVSNRILKAMNRKTNKEDISELFLKLRNNIEDMVIRTTFIVGFPGEEDEDFEELMKFINENPIDKLGAFKYSREEDTKAYLMDNQIDEITKEDRINELMEIQSIISQKLLEEKIGKTLDVLIEEKYDDYNYGGRTYLDAPEIDGICYIKSDEELKIGEFVKVKIIDNMEYDLVGEKI